MMRSNILILAYAGLVSALPNADCNIKSLEAGFSAENIITRDVLVVGGGSGGTYTATRLQQEGKSVAVVEKELILGGMTNTYTVPGTDITIDYGVIVFHNISLVRDYFSYYNIALAPSDLGENSTDYNINFVTGEVVNGPAPNETLAIEALDAYLVQLDKYPYLTTGFNLPDPVPEDLLIPFKDFVTKYNLAPMVPFSQLGGGQADLLEQATLYAFKILGPDLARSVTAGLITTAAHDNSALYEAAAAK
jgi:phytoene dehydrogenase-like protein